MRVQKIVTFFLRWIHIFMMIYTRATTSTFIFIRSFLIYSFYNIVEIFFLFSTKHLDIARWSIEDSFKLVGNNWKNLETISKPRIKRRAYASSMDWLFSDLSIINLFRSLFRNPRQQKPLLRHRKFLISSTGDPPPDYRPWDRRRRSAV